MNERSVWAFTFASRRLAIVNAHTDRTQIFIALMKRNNSRDLYQKLMNTKGVFT